MSLDHVLRLTVRFNVGAYLGEADLALPKSSSLAEMIPEIVELCGAPRISRPWQATTAAGSPLDPAVPVHQTPLDHGSVLVLTPRHEVPAPVIKDAAESLVADDEAPLAHGMSVAAALVGCIGLMSLVSIWQPTSQALAAGSVAALTVLVWHRKSGLLANTAIVLATAAAAIAVVEASTISASDTNPWWEQSLTLGWAGLAASGMMAAVTAGVALVGLLGARSTTAMGAIVVLSTVASAGAFLPAHAAELGVASAALMVAVGIPLIGMTPALAARCAGLKVPRLPTAGQDLSVADHIQDDVGDRARRALLVHEGLAIGTALALIPAMVIIGVEGSGFAQALCLSVAGAVSLHAARHRRLVIAWSLLSVGLAASVGAVLAAVLSPSHPSQVLLAVMVMAAAVSAPLWTPRVPELEPTTIVWWERAESLAIAAALPLAAHLAGAFLLIRSLG
ncbi:type VII secretion integral membrane protein EccD [Corynebacterium alimapuense]|uniref:Type VII secretion integral membrane protein EccD n=1 Tax=Corynebacterium alimapuense TaxID=1576874 RepID=A0A3M8K6W2_9CORY|nr:type VII secretion integral membrane protein EccD [Corynebacterium alimapuense]RNE48870.1 type VII secretion integral membrane protein EccD [Corynebacterium alimapuense]